MVNNTKRSVVKRLTILGVSLAVTLTLTIWLVPIEYLIYFQSIQLSIAGYFVIDIIANTAFRLAVATQQSAQTASSLKSLNKDSRSSRGCCHRVIISQPKRCSGGINRNFVGTCDRFCFTESFGKRDSRYVFVVDEAI